MNTYKVVRFVRPCKADTFYKTYDVMVGKDYMAEIDAASGTVTLHDEIFAGGSAKVKDAKWGHDYRVM